MKIKFIIILYILTVILLGCTDKIDRYKNFKLPDKNEYSEVILAILQQDTIFINQGALKSEFVAIDMPKQWIDINIVAPDTIGSKIIRPPVEYNGPHTTIRELIYFKLTDPLHIAYDSVYFAFQNDSAKLIAIDSNIVNFVRFANKEMLEKIKPKPYSGYFQFLLPIFNKDLTKAYVGCNFLCTGLCGEGWINVLEKVNGKWKIKFQRSVWVS